MSSKSDRAAKTIIETMEQLNGILGDAEYLEIAKAALEIGFPANTGSHELSKLIAQEDDQALNLKVAYHLIDHTLEAVTDCEHCGRESALLVGVNKGTKDTPEDPVYAVCPECTQETPEPRYHPVFDSILKGLSPPCH